jgi:hypothetical protein
MGLVRERRQHVRFKVAIAVGMKGDSIAVITATMEDISHGGAFIKTERPPTRGAEVDIVVMRDGGPPISLPATVCRALPDGVGVAWRELGDAQRSFVLALLDGTTAL